MALAARGARNLIPDGFIGVAPRGRGTSNCFTADHAQEDIAEVIATVIEDYPIDTSKIVLAGFSMGGYGVYRTQYETPNRFCGLAIFSGHPNLANLWYPEGNHPDFTDPDMLKAFAEMPIFIFHGELDRNASFDVLPAEVELLKKAGAKMEYYFEADKGHEEASRETLDAYFEWIDRVVGGDGE